MLVIRKTGAGGKHANVCSYLSLALATVSTIMANTEKISRHRKLQNCMHQMEATLDLGIYKFLFNSMLFYFTPHIYTLGELLQEEGS